MLAPDAAAWGITLFSTQIWGTVKFGRVVSVPYYPLPSLTLGQRLTKYHLGDQGGHHLADHFVMCISYSQFHIRTFDWTKPPRALFTNWHTLTMAGATPCPRTKCWGRFQDVRLPANRRPGHSGLCGINGPGVEVSALPVGASARSPAAAMDSKTSTVT